MRVLITGSRNHDPSMVSRAIVQWVKNNRVPGERVTIIHGDATGADQGAHRASMELPECAEVRVPARWSMGKSAGPARNIEMLDEYHPHNVLAFPIGESRGTRHCISEARARGIHVLVFEGTGATPTHGPAT